MYGGFSLIRTLKNVKTLKFWLYGKMGLKPSEVYGLDIHVIQDLITARIDYESYQFDYDMTLLAWQTSLLMNSTGNYKKKIKPSDIYTPLGDGDTAEYRKPADNEKTKEQLQQELINSFDLSKCSIK